MKLKDYIHLYIGCDVFYPNLDGKITTAKLTGCSITDGLETTYKRKKQGISGDNLSWKSNGSHDTDALHVMLILRRFKDMTEDEMNCLELDASSRMLVKANIVMYMNPNMFKKCLDMHFDMFGLIEAGLAAEKIKKS